jgi:hypothetical protein
MDIRELAEGLYLEDYVESEKKELEQRVKNDALLLAFKTMLKNPDGKRVL